MQKVIISVTVLTLAAGLVVCGYFWGISEGKQALSWRDQAELEVVQKALTLLQDNKAREAREFLESRERAIRSGHH